MDLADSLRVWLLSWVCVVDLGWACDPDGGSTMNRLDPSLRFPAIKSDLSNVHLFWMRVDQDRDDGCWGWRRSLTKAGYGNLVVEGGTKVLAHRFSYELANGPIPEGLELDHLCRNTFCVNPTHLEPVTHAENVRRGLACFSVRKVCRRNHDVSDGSPNVFVDKDGWKRCRQCRLDAQRKRRAANR